MSLVQSTTTNDDEDDCFIAEVSLHMMERSKAMQTHIAAMIEAYLPHRLAQLRCAVEADFAAEREALTLARTRAEEAHRACQAQLDETRDALTRAQALIHYHAVRVAARDCFHHWVRVAERGRARRRHAAAWCAQREFGLTQRCYFRWALVTRRRRQEEVCTRTRQERDTAVAALQSRVAEMEQMRQAERARQVHLQNRLTVALQRGVSAFSREAGQVLRPASAALSVGGGEEHVGETDVNAEHGMDSGKADMGSHLNNNNNNNVQQLGSAHTRQHQTVNSNDEDMDDVLMYTSSLPNSTAHVPHGSPHSRLGEIDGCGGEPPVICPVHHRDRAGHVYHRCYAPHVAGGCPTVLLDGRGVTYTNDEEEDDVAMGGKPSMTRRADNDYSAVAEVPHVPFVVTMDAKASRPTRTGGGMANSHTPVSGHLSSTSSWRARERAGGAAATRRR